MICTWAMYFVGCYQSFLSRVLLLACLLAWLIACLLACVSLPPSRPFSLSYALLISSFLSCARSLVLRYLVFLNKCSSSSKQQHRLAQAARAILYIHITLLAFPRAQFLTFLHIPPLLPLHSPKGISPPARSAGVSSNHQTPKISLCLAERL